MKNNIIKSTRCKLRLEQATFAKELGVTVSAVSNWERGIRHPKLSNLKKLEDMATKKGIKFNIEDFNKGKY